MKDMCCLKKFSEPGSFLSFRFGEFRLEVFEAIAMEGGAPMRKKVEESGTSFDDDIVVRLDFRRGVIVVVSCFLRFEIGVNAEGVELLLLLFNGVVRGGTSCRGELSFSPSIDGDDAFEGSILSVTFFCFVLVLKDIKFKKERDTFMFYAKKLWKIVLLKKS